MARKYDVGIQDAIVSALRERIVGGGYAPGMRLPARPVLCTEFQATPVTVQNAIHRLVGEGFLFTRDRQGTYVSQDPPHLSCYGVVLPTNPLAEPPSGRFYSMLAYTCLGLQQTGMNLRLYYPVTGHTDEEPYLRALDDMEAHRVAGLFIARPYSIRHTPLVTAPGFPRVQFVAQPHLLDPQASVKLPDLPSVYCDVAALRERALQACAAQGCGRVCVVTNGNEATTSALVEAHGMVMAPHCYVEYDTNVSDPCFFTALRQYITLVMERPDRPEAVIIHDDIFVDHVIAGIQEAGLKPMEDVYLVAQCLYPLQRQDSWPIARLGHDIRHLLRTAFAVIDQQVQGRTPDIHTPIPALFRDEVSDGVIAHNIL